MAVKVILCSLLVLLSSFTGFCTSLFIDGCPLYGCRPSGSFSFYLDLPKANASIKWQNRFILDPVPNVLGCAADSVSIVCQSNGPFSDNKGYVSLYRDNGTVRWRDGVLYFPTLPILDNYGDVTGSDGTSLVHFDADGKNYPIIPCQDMKPIFSMQLVGSMYLLMVSQLGGLSVRDTNAIPVAEIFLNDTVQRTNGTFLPISQPVVNGNRFYLLTEFVPNSDQNVTSDILNLQRLYAIDIHHRMADIMTIAWYYNFEMEGKVSAFTKTMGKSDQNKEVYNDASTVDAKAFRKAFKKRQESITRKQILLWDDSNGIVYVILPPPYASNSPTTFWGLRDAGNSTSLAFRSSLDVTHMAIFEANDESDKTTKYHVEPSILWASLANGKICSIRPDGSITRCIDLSASIGSAALITSKISLVRSTESDKDILVLGVTVPNFTLKFRSLLKKDSTARMNTTSYVIALDTGPDSGKVLWSVPVPENLEVKGQITGSGGAPYQEKDQVVVFAETAGVSAKIFTIT